MLDRCRFAATLVLCLAAATAAAQDGSSGKLSLPDNLFNGDSATSGAEQSVVSSGEAPPAAYSSGTDVSYSAAGASYSESLGAHLRARYHTQSYGQPEGNLDLGTMLMLDNGDTSWFFDGQVTLNDETQVGFNVGAGFRALHYGDLVGEKLLGMSIWADGSSTLNDNFFPQLGLSYELLGDQWDLRANASFVLGDRTQVGTTQRTGGIGYLANNLSQLTVTGQDDAMHLTEVELARRLLNRELWGFAGAYGLYGEEQDTTGYQLGVRGYALPDLALQFKVTDDDLFGTNLVFSGTWFIGRTRTNTRIKGGLLDRMREPVLRNDYVAVHNTTIAGGDALTNDFDGDGTSEDIRFVHIDSTAADGGDGTFENPFNSLDDATGNTQANDVLLVHGGSSTTADTGVTLLDGQRLLGEGNNMAFTIATDQLGTINIPETATDAQTLATPDINLAAGATGVILADGNEVANLNFLGGATAIASAGTGSSDGNVHDASFSNQTGNAITLSPLERVDSGTTTVAFNNALQNLTFDNVGGYDIALDGTPPSVTVGDPNVALSETILIDSITSTNNAGSASLLVQDTNTGGSVTVSNYTYDGGTTSGGGVEINNTAGTVDVITNSTFTGGAAGAEAFNITNPSGVVSVGTTVSVTDMPIAAVIDGNSANVDFAATVSNTTASGGTVTVQNNTGAVAINGDITSQDATTLAITDALANVTISSNLTRNGTAGIAVDINDNAAGDGAAIEFSNPTTTIAANGGSQAFDIDGGDDDVTVLAMVTDTGGITVDGRTGGTVDFGTSVTSTTATNDAVLLTNNAAASSILFNNLDITTTTGRGLVAEGGVGTVNVTGTSSITTGNTTGALVLDGTTAQPLVTTGITFDSIDTGAGSTNAIVLDNVEGLVQVNGGVLNTTANAALQVNNATDVLLTGVELASGGAAAVQASYDSDNTNLLSLSNADLNGDSVTVATTTSTAGANTSVSLSDITEGGLFDFDTSGAGNLNTLMTNVEGNALTTLDVAGSGNGSLAMTNVNTGAGVIALSTGASTGDLSLTMTNSGNTTAFTDVTVDDNGNGAVTADLTNTAVSGNLDLDADGNGAASFDVSGGSVDGTVNIDANNTTGVANVSLDGNGTYGSTVDINVANQANATVTMAGTDVTGATTITATNTGTFNANVNGAGNFDSSLAITATNAGDATVNVIGNNTIDGTTNITTNNNGAATVGMDGTYNDVVTVAANNVGDYDFSLTAANVNAGAAAVGFDLDLGNNVEDANLAFLANTYDSGLNINADSDGALNLQTGNDTITTGSDDVAFTLAVGSVVDNADILLANSEYNTNDATALLFTNDANGQIRFQLDDNDFVRSGNGAAANLTSNTGTLSATIGGTALGFNGNRFTNGSNASNQLVVTGDGASATVNLLLEGNTANSGLGNFNLVEANGATFSLFDSVNVNAQTENQGTVLFDPNFAAFDDLATEPTAPSF